MATRTLYTPEVLAMATCLAEWPWDPGLPRIGEARSSTCGSQIELGVLLDPHDRIARIGLRVRACAIGQAAAAIFAKAAAGRNAEELGAALRALETWLAGAGEAVAWPSLDAISAARDYPARHGAIVLPWKAALAALSSVPARG